MFKLDVNNLYIEITRRCNQACLHCMRGPGQNIDLSSENIDQLFNNEKFKIENIDTLFIMGGEPFLAKESFVYLLETIIKQDIKINCLICHTNGLIYDQDIIDLLNILKPKTDVQLYTFHDQFHQNISPLNLAQFQKIPYYYYVEVKRSLTDQKKTILRTGNALKNFGMNEATHEYLQKFYMYNSSYVKVDYEHDDIFSTENLWINAYGQVASINYRYVDGSWSQIDHFCHFKIKQMVNHLKLQTITKHYIQYVVDSINNLNQLDEEKLQKEYGLLFVQELKNALINEEKEEFRFNIDDIYLKSMQEKLKVRSLYDTHSC